MEVEQAFVIGLGAGFLLLGVLSYPYVEGLRQKIKSYENRAGSKPQKEEEDEFSSYY